MTSAGSDEHIELCVFSHKVNCFFVHSFIFPSAYVCISRRSANGAVMCSTCAICTMTFCWTVECYGDVFTWSVSRLYLEFVNK